MTQGERAARDVTAGTWLQRVVGSESGNLNELADSEAPYWSQDASALAASLGSGRRGLSAERAAQLLVQVGANSVEDASRLSGFRLLLRQFESPLVLILVFAAATSLALQDSPRCLSTY